MVASRAVLQHENARQVTPPGTGPGSCSPAKVTGVEKSISLSQHFKLGFLRWERNQKENLTIGIPKPIGQNGWSLKQFWHTVSTCSHHLLLKQASLIPGFGRIGDRTSSERELFRRRITMLLSPNASVVFFCCFEQLEMAIT